jgi:hypothetical protein
MNWPSGRPAFYGWQAGETIYPAAYSYTVTGDVLFTAQWVKSGGVPAPTGLTATALSSSEIMVSWNPVSGAASYRVYRSTNRDSGYSNSIASPSTASYTDTGRYAATTYYYKVSAYNSAGGESGQSESVSATTLAPGSPVTPSGGKTLTITGIPATVISPGDGGQVGIFLQGTTSEQALQMSGLVAEGWASATPAGSAYTLSLSLSTTDGYPWTGSGTYDIYSILYSEEGGRYYRFSSVNFSATTTTISFSSAIEIFMDRDKDSSGVVPERSFRGILESAGGGYR